MNKKYDWYVWHTPPTSCHCATSSPPCSYCTREEQCPQCCGDLYEDERYCDNCGYVPNYEESFYKLTGEHNMSEYNKYANLIAVLNEDLTTVACHVLGKDDGDLYLFKASKELAKTLTKNDTVLAGSVFSPKTMSIWTIKEIHDEVDISPDSEKQYDFVFQKVDEDALSDLISFEEKNVGSLKQHRKAALKEQYLMENKLNGIKLIK